MPLFDRLTTAQFNEYRSDYERDGVVCVSGLFDSATLDLLHQTAAEALASPSASMEIFGMNAASGRFFADTGLERFASFKRFLITSATAELAGRLMRSDVARLFFSQILVKEPGAPKPTPWHQDLPYWPVSGEKICSTWIALDGISACSGLRFIAGSQSWQEHSPRDFQEGLDYGPPDMPSLTALEASGSPHPVLNFSMNPGDCAIFNAMTAHSAPTNCTGGMRRAISIRWLGDDARHRHRQSRQEQRSVGSQEKEGKLLDDDKEFPLLWPLPEVE